jgi:hypothetical protein
MLAGMVCCRFKSAYLSGYNLHKKVLQTIESLLPGNALYAVLAFRWFIFQSQFAKYTSSYTHF